MKKYFKMNNRGASLLTVIIVMSIVAILGVSAVYMALTGLNMRLVDRKSKNNFYTAESVLDHLATGLQEKMAKAYGDAYIHVMSSYSDYDSVGEMNAAFTSEFVLNMVDVVKLDTNPEKYDIDKLTAMVNAADFPNGTRTIGFSTVNPGENALETLNDGLMLRNVLVEYKEKGYTDKISTDIKITVPSVAFSMIASVPNITDYAYIADDGISVNGGAVLTLVGSAYSGAADNMSNAITLNASAKMNAENASYLIAGGNVEMKGVSQLTTGTKTSFWLRDLEASDLPGAGATDAVRREIALKGLTYVADDITLNGFGNKLTLAGEFYAYGHGNDASGSSAIIINGLNTTLDLKQLDTMMVAGTSYVSSAAVQGNAGTEANTNIPLGDSIAVKSNQLAFLVPTSCEGIICNPMSEAQFTALRNSITDAQEIADGVTWKSKALNTRIADLNNRTIASYGTVDITPVHTKKENGSVYLFLDFNHADADTRASEAAAFFFDMYNSPEAGARLQQYISNYLVAFSFNQDESGAEAFTRLETNGTYLMQGHYDENQKKWVYGADDGGYYTGRKGLSHNIQNEISGFGSTYEALTTKLVNSLSGLTPDEKTKKVYANLVDEQVIREFLAKTPKTSDAGYTINNNTAVFSNGKSGADAVTAIVVDNAANAEKGIAGFVYEVDSNTPCRNGIILATGDVQVKADWNGVIICGGKLTVAANATLTSDEAITGEAMRLSGDIEPTGAEKEKTSYVVLNFFIGGENFSINKNKNDSDLTDVRNCITYKNWKSE